MYRTLSTSLGRKIPYVLLVSGNYGAVCFTHVVVTMTFVSDIDNLRIVRPFIKENRHSPSSELHPTSN